MSSISIEKFGIGKECIIRTYSAGVHFGTVVDRAGTEVLLKNARRIWYWDKAFTLNAVANSGAGDGTKMSEPVAEILLTESIEVLPCAGDGAKWLTERVAHEA
jgi:hypothetical protein